MLYFIPETICQQQAFQWRGLKTSIRIMDEITTQESLLQALEAEDYGRVGGLLAEGVRRLST